MSKDDYIPFVSILACMLVILGFTSCQALKNHVAVGAIAEMVKDGANPIVASCAVWEVDSRKNVLCATALD